MCLKQINPQTTNLGVGRSNRSGRAKSSSKISRLGNRVASVPLILTRYQRLRKITQYFQIVTEIDASVPNDFQVFRGAKLAQRRATGGC
jgi:hypothetical protein